jgi:hypothetical protein
MILCLKRKLKSPTMAKTKEAKIQKLYLFVFQILIQLALLIVQLFGITFFSPDFDSMSCSFTSRQLVW